MKALIIVDTQNDFCEGGALGVRDSALIFPIINALKASSYFEKVFLTKDWHPKDHVSFGSTHKLQPFQEIHLQGGTQMLWPDHCVQNSYGSELSPLLEVDGKEILVKKGYHKGEQTYSGFGTEENPTELKQKLNEIGIKQVVVVGLALDYCVGSTALDAGKAGFETTIISDATKSVSIETGNLMIEKLKKAKVNYISAEDLIEDQQTV